jgi:hypothetical protein
VTDFPSSTITTGDGGALPWGWLIVVHMLLRPSSVGICWVSWIHVVGRMTVEVRMGLNLRRR